jgi:endoglucanase
MSTSLRQKLQQLSEAVGVSGGESEVRKLILESIKDQVGQVTIDPMGNISAVRKGTGQSPLRVMVTAHMDENGFMITDIGENGLISVEIVGGHDDRFTAGQRVLVGTAKMPGVFLWIPIHKSHSHQELIDAEKMQIDVGADNKGGVSAKLGERVAFMGAYAELGSLTVRGKAFESRPGCAALIELINGDPFPFDLHVVFTAQESIGGRGAAVAAHRIAPQVAFVLRSTESNDLPGDPDNDRAPIIRLGQGPALTVLDPGLIGDRRLVEHVRDVAQAQGIPCQIDAQNTTRSEGGAVSLSRAGVPTLVIAVPVRYLNSPNALLNLDDLENTVRLLRETLAALRPEQLER